MGDFNTYKHLTIFLYSFVPAVQSVTQLGFPNFKLHGRFLEQTIQKDKEIFKKKYYTIKTRIVLKFLTECMERNSALHAKNTRKTMA